MDDQKEGCKERVSDIGGWHSHRCTKKVWKDGYCKIHHPESVEARRKKSEVLYEEKTKNSPWNQLRIARERIKELEAKVALLESMLREPL